ncbi:hypothetical protein SU60_17300 [Vibrio mytili]|uniref:Uncharacterized protein n=1 Tax=Vibrio mytili TaxID=50718 RepID=A0A0C3HNS3_9VIBR|nr:hypothetical protein SU60_17300 [Vibrio mytili]
MSLPVTNVNAANANNDALNRLDPISAPLLEQYRGGFKVSNEYIINIGLSITTTINGEDVFNSSIANLIIENGNLTNIHSNNTPDNPQLDQGIVNIVQLGEGNIITDDFNSFPTSQQPNITSSEFINSSIINIIQNTTDNSVIGLSTLVDIDAQVNGVIQQIRANQQLEDALLNHLQ